MRPRRAVILPSPVSWRRARRGMRKVGAATLLFAAWHSLLCADSTKNGARRLLGARHGTALYRAFFIAQSTLTTGALAFFIWKQPHRVLYQARGWKRILGWAAQAGALGLAFCGLRELDGAKFAGIQGVRSLRENRPVAEAQAQGPEIESDGEIRATGVFRYSRHPLEWAPLLLLFCSPTMKTNWLVFDVLATVYSLLGALHEEKRLLRHSKKYAAYQKQVAFFLSWPRP